MGTIKDPIRILNRNSIEWQSKEIWKTISHKVTRDDDEESGFWFEISSENFGELWCRPAFLAIERKFARTSDECKTSGPKMGGHSS
jgi:hypothetical protein